MQITTYFPLSWGKFIQEIDYLSFLSDNSTATKPTNGVRRSESMKEIKNPIFRFFPAKEMIKINAIHAIIAISMGLGTKFNISNFVGSFEGISRRNKIIRFIILFFIKPAMKPDCAYFAVMQCILIHI